MWWVRGVKGELSSSSCWPPWEWPGLGVAPGNLLRSCASVLKGEAEEGVLCAGLSGTAGAAQGPQAGVRCGFSLQVRLETRVKGVGRLG